MATHQQRHSGSKSLKWLSNKTLKLNLNLISFHAKRSHKHDSASTLSSPTSYPNSPRATSDNDVVGRRDHSVELRQVFSRFDGDGDGKISAYELRSYFGSVGEYISHEAAQAVIDEVDSDGDGFLGFEDFFGLMTRRDDLDGGDSNSDLKTAFEMFELEKGSGCITPKGLQKMLARLGEVRSFTECEAMIRVYDIDGNGVLDFQEFSQMMTV
ncbi:PREDICTED: probable calcium-binding protein CML41 [Tarenaya hassleriana]|uniref:probable calcium-binding protein CML41 n=1 Tax=Tarenaya hassleriana TaxID=28532 RepID=UPI00053C36F9|nr:PREDICTED: probable calcium-binding protein CML41 [Tarenaya hassleriana]